MEPTTDDAVPAGHVVHGPQAMGQAAWPTGTLANEHEGDGTSFATHDEVQVRVDCSVKMSSPLEALLPVMTTDEESSRTVDSLMYNAPP